VREKHCSGWKKNASQPTEADQPNTLQACNPCPNQWKDQGYNPCWPTCSEDDSFQIAASDEEKTSGREFIPGRVLNVILDYLDWPKSPVVHRANEIDCHEIIWVSYILLSRTCLSITDQVKPTPFFEFFKSAVQNVNVEVGYVQDSNDELDTYVPHAHRMNQFMPVILNTATMIVVAFLHIIWNG